MNKLTTEAIILKRTNFSEADRILTLLTPGHGKIRAIAKGVRKEKSKLAGGLELLSISQIGYLKGRGELDQIVSTRLLKHFEGILSDYDRVQLAYKAIELIDKVTEDDASKEYYELLDNIFRQIDNPKNKINELNLWMRLQLLSLFGNLPNLTHDSEGKKLVEDQKYKFDSNDGCFVASSSGDLDSNHIKVWRILTSNTPSQARQVSGLEECAEQSIDYLVQFTRNVFLVD